MNLLITKPEPPIDTDGHESETTNSGESIQVDAQMNAKPNLVALFFYDGRRYYMDTGNEYVPMDQRSVVRHLRAKGAGASEIEAALCEIQTDQYIHFAGPLAGHKRGIHRSGGSKLLATDSPQIIKPRQGEWTTLKAVVEGLLGNDPEADNLQVDIFFAWLKIARESLTLGRRRPGQALALAGAVGCGKSLLLDIIEAALGGRRANPYPFFSGKTSFNADLAGAELLAVDDEAGSTDIRARKNLAANIKSNLFSGAVRIEGKGKTAFTLSPTWRMVIALNDEPEALLVLPPITEDLADKVTMLHCHRRQLPMPAHTIEERDAFFSTLMAELPLMLHWLESWHIPSDITEERCGVMAYHHPSIIGTLHELSAEGALIQMIDTAAEAGGIQLPWQGTAAQLKGLLIECQTTSRDAQSLLGKWQAATGTYLSRLEGHRVEKQPLRNGTQRWRIKSSGVVE